MWILKKLNDGPTKYLISENKNYTVGRKNCDFILEEDASISRKHCTIYIAKQSECPFTINTMTGIWIVDEQSKYGTYLKNGSDWIKMTPNQNTQINSGSIIKFGLMENIWSLKFKPLVACTSGIQLQQKKKIEGILKTIDGILKNVWCKECTLVVVNEITLTIKVVLALINGVPIVTPNYIEKVAESIKNQAAFPDYQNFRPDIKESILDASLVSLDVKQHRKELFKGMKFVIPARKQFETLKEVITSAGGKIELLSKDTQKNRLAEENTILIQLPINDNTIPSDLNNLFKEITSFLKNNHNRRVIPESEIAQAVAYSSTEKYCNPKSNCFNLTRSERQPSPGILLVEETPEASGVQLSSSHVIPASATLESHLNSMLNSQFSNNCEKHSSQKLFSERKRLHSPEHDEIVQQKKSRNKKSFKDSDDEAQKNVPFTEKNDQNQKTDTNSTTSKKNTNKLACITDYFPKRNTAPSKDQSQVPNSASLSFWSSEKTNERVSKRKFSTDSDGFSENSNRKKAKLPETNTRNETPPREVVDFGFNEHSNRKKAKLPENNKTIETPQREVVDLGFSEHSTRKRAKQPETNTRNATPQREVVDFGFNEHSNRKKAKLPETNTRNETPPRTAIQTPREVVEVVEQQKSRTNSFEIIKTNYNETEKDFTDYIEKEKNDAVKLSADDLDTTIYSLTLISPAYLKEDGSLIEPPSMLKNVKKFKKQKIHANLIITPVEEKEDDLSDGEWLEPHSGRLNISIAQEKEW